MPRAWSLSVPALDSKWVVDTGMFEATEEVDVKACCGENVQRYDGLQLKRVPGEGDIARQRVVARATGSSIVWVGRMRDKQQGDRCQGYLAKV